MSKKKLIGSLILNTFTVISVIVCIIILLKKNNNTFRMFTTQSNVFSGVVGLIIVIFEILILLKKRNELPKWVKVVKMVTTTGVTLTFIVVVFYLGFVAVAQGHNYFIVFRNTNVFFHFLTPLSAILSFVLFEGTDEINFKLTFLNVIHMAGYSIFYTINVFTHLSSDGKVQRKYDWYYFVQGENWTLGAMAIGLLLVTFGIGFILWWSNKKIYNKRLFE